MNFFKVGSPLVYKQSELESPLKFEQPYQSQSYQPQLYQIFKQKDAQISDRFIPNRVTSNLSRLFLEEDTKEALRALVTDPHLAGLTLSR